MIYISADLDSASSKDFQLQREQPRRCQRETLAAPTGTMALNSLMCVRVCVGGLVRLGGSKTAVCTQTDCLHPSKSHFPSIYKDTKGWHPTPTLRTAGRQKKSGVEVCARRCQNQAWTRLNIKWQPPHLAVWFNFAYRYSWKFRKKVFGCASPLPPLMFTVQIKDSNGVNLP